MTESAGSTLRRLVERPEILVVPGVTNALYARIAEQAGFEAIFTSGAGIANTLIGVPDLGLLTMSEGLLVTQYVARSISVPTIADADTGYGGPLNVIRTIQELEQAGIAAATIEDQAVAKRCGHFDGKAVEPIEVMVERIVAARSARTNPDFMIIARTDAYASEGLEVALKRARAYAMAGADVIFVEAPETEEDLKAIPKSVDRPCLVNLVEGGRTPLLPARRLEEFGFSIVLHANLALRAGAWGVKRALTALRSTGTSDQFVNEILSWEERQKLVSLDEWEQRRAEVTATASELLARRKADAQLPSSNIHDVVREVVQSDES